jgi:hypothetical protein
MSEHNEALEAFLRVFDERLEQAPLIGEERRSGEDRRRSDALGDTMRAVVRDVRARRAIGPSDRRAFAYWVTGPGEA